MGIKPKANANATVAAIQQNMQNMPAMNAKLAMNKPATPQPQSRSQTPAQKTAPAKPQTPMQQKASPAKPQTPIQQKAAPVKPQTPSQQKAVAPKEMPAAPRNLQAKPSSANPPPKSKINPLAPLTPGKAAAGLPDNVFGNMFDLPPKWVAACKPSKPAQLLRQQSAKPQQKQQQQQLKQKQFSRKPRAPKNSTNEIFNLQFLFNDNAKFASCAPVPPKRMPGDKKAVAAPVPQMQHRPLAGKPIAPTKAVAVKPMIQQKAAPAPVKQRAASAKKYDLGPGYEVHMMASLFNEPQNWTKNQAPCHAPHRTPKPVSKPSSPTRAQTPSSPKRK
ncbi:UNVERIFIED_CONTAM: hypothetical protein HDU68_007783 [Siphonaria sp. JEL0065]|nr:hypothetical protein HDU68_007783 [Siphonaria sp. JEL0065]